MAFAAAGGTMAVGFFSSMIVLSLFLSPLGPALVLALAGLLAMLGRRLAQGVLWRAAQVGASLGSLAASVRLLAWARMPFAAVTVGLATLLWASLRRPGANAALSLDWQPLTVAGSALAWRMDGWNWLVSGLILILAAVALVLPTSFLAGLPFLRGGPATTPAPRLDRRGIGWERSLWLAAAALVFVGSYNVLTLAVGWVLFDAVLALRLHPTVHPELAGRAWGLLSLAMLLLVLALTILGEAGIRTALDDPRLDRFVLTLLWLLALIRAGVYPLHFWLAGSARSERGEALALSSLAPLTGVWLLVRLHGIAGPDWLRRPEWVALGAVALLGTAMVAWAAEDELQRWRWIVLNRASLVVMAAYMAGGSGPETLVWPVLVFVVGGALLLLAQALQEDGSRAPAWVAVLVLWGLPGTVGFMARTALVFPTGLAVAVPLFGLVLLAEILLVAALWQSAAAAVSRQPLGPIRRWALRGLFILLLAASLAAGLVPAGLARLVGWPADESFPALGTLLLGARRSVWGALAVSGVLGAALGLWRERVFGQMRGWQRGIVTIVSLEWLYRAVANGFNLAAAGLRYFATLGEGEGYLGWLALAGVILWALLRG
ncbi:MAG: hypothetical protein ACUVR4_01025 [Anaerolineae bacterium]